MIKPEDIKVEVTSVADAYKIGDLYYASAMLDGETVTITAKRDDPAWLTDPIVEMLRLIDAAIEAGDLTEAEMEARGVAVVERNKAAEAKRIADYQASLTYIERRQMAYAPLVQQLDMQYWDRINGTDTWGEHIAEVKARFPKPKARKSA